MIFINKKVQHTLGDNYFRYGEPIFINISEEQIESHLHAHDFLEIAYVTSGKGVHYIGDRKYDVSKGDLFVINYDVAHEFRSIEGCDEKLIICNCVFKPEFLDYTLINCKEFKDITHHFLFNSLFPNENKLTNDIKILGENSEEIDQLYNKMYKEYTNRETGYIEILRAYVIELLVIIFRIYKKQSGVSHQTESDKKHLIEKAIIYMKDNYDKDLKLEDLSMMSFFSRNYFCRLFKETTGVTVVEFIQKIRIQQACSLLKETNNTITSIANQVGYGNIKFFGELFKRYTGKTPSAYRKQYNPTTK